MPSEMIPYIDALTGTKVTQLTNHKCHSHHLYFTNPGWHDRNRRLLFGSDRGGRTNLFSIELATGYITQITDADMPDETLFLFASVNPCREEAYFFRGRKLIAVNLITRKERLLYEAPDNFDVNMTNVSADGRYVCTGIYERAGGFKADLLRGYVGFREYFEQHPLSRIVRVPVDGGAAETLHEERNWIGHVNTSPTQPHLMTFCHEGPWDLVQQRIWGLDMNTGKVWKIRPQDDGMVCGHEYWFADGLRIGFHGRSRAVSGRQATYGAIEFDNTDHVEAPFPYDSQHFFSHDLSLIVGDGSRGHSWDRQGRRDLVMLWQFENGQFVGPRVLCEHRGSAHVQQTHIHPRFSPDMKHVLFTSDMTGYGQLYLAELKPFAELPTIEQVWRK